MILFHLIPAYHKTKILEKVFATTCSKNNNNKKNDISVETIPDTSYLIVQMVLKLSLSDLLIK